MINLHITSDIINGCKDKKPWAQESLYKTCYVVFMKICLRYANNYDDAAIVLNDSFMKIFNKIGLYDTSGDFIGWMRRIVVNTAIDFTRKKKEAFDELTERTLNIEESDANEQEKFVIDEQNILTLIKSLPKTQAQVFNLYAIDEYSHEEIAKLLQISVESSRQYLFSARKQLKQEILKISK